ncbi:MAG: hypothetical protein K0U38_05235 [Epsilonproteobacteria bacterium]|nr:hypothetical protein [Campylobacterota bacterium]
MIEQKVYENMIENYINQTIVYYKMASKERGEIHRHQWEHNVSPNDSILFEIESLNNYIVGYADSTMCGMFERFQETIENLSPKSIYTSPIIVNWLTPENIEQYPNYFNYILLVENLRVLTVKTCIFYHTSIMNQTSG